MILGYKIYGDKAARSQIEKSISFIGQSTLQIYVLHYYFFKAFRISFLQAFISTHNRFIDDFLLTPPHFALHCNTQYYISEDNL